MKKKIIWLSLLLIFLLYPLGHVYGMSGNRHVTFTQKYVGGIANGTVKGIHSQIIDTVPWWKGSGGGEIHRKYWGHTKEWYYNGKIPRDAIRDVAKRNNVSYTKAKEIIQKDYFHGLGNGRNLIAQEIKKVYPYLSDAESYALADQVYISHTWADNINNLAKTIMKENPGIKYGEALKLAENAMSSSKKTFIQNGIEIRKPSGTPRTPKILRYPPAEAIKAQYKISIKEATQNNVAPKTFANQSVNYERWKIVKFSEEHNLKIYNPKYKNYTGISFKGKNYVYASTKSRALKMLSKGESCVVPDEIHSKIVKSHPEYENKMVNESKVTGKSSNLKTDRKQCAEDFKSTVQENQASIASRNKNVLAKAKKLYQDNKAILLSSALVSLMENWGYIKEAYRGEVEWGKVAQKVSIDWAGYTCSTMAVKGILYYTPGINKILGMAPGIRLGATTVIGIFVWKSGKQYVSFVKGDISQEELLQRTKDNAGELEMGMISIPCSMVITNIFIAAGAPGWVAGAVIVGGQFAFVKGKEYYDDKKWAHNVPINDLYAVLGPEYINKFTFINPEKHFSFIKPETHYSIVDPETHYSIINPETHYSIINSGKNNF